jgi:hypothetical protein
MFLVGLQAVLLGKAMERCLACEAVVSKGNRDEYAFLVGALCRHF